jgi:hypothetical protein
MRFVALLHRWLGIFGCLLFITWFASGIVMIYARMPQPAPHERPDRSPVLDLSTATLSPSTRQRNISCCRNARRSACCSGGRFTDSRIAAVQ